MNQIVTPHYKFFNISFVYKKKYLEGVVRRYSVKKALLKISQNSQENTCDRVSA